MATNPSTQTSPPNVGAGGNGKNLVPFRRATIGRTKLISQQGPFSFVGQGVNAQSNNVVGEGLLYSMVMNLQSKGGTGATTPAAYFEDAPYSIIDQWSLADPNSTVIQLSGYNAFLGNLLQGSYRDQYFQAAGNVDVMGAPLVLGNSGLFQNGDPNGNFAFTLDIPIALNRRTLSAMLGNQSKSTVYTLANNVAAGTGSTSGPVFTTAPVGGTAPTLLINGSLHNYTIPPQGAQPLPADYGKLHRLSQATSPQAPTSGGQIEHQITQIGRQIRGMVLVYRSVNNTGVATRANVETATPTMLELQLGDTGVYKESWTSRRAEMFRQFGFQWPVGTLAYADGLCDFAPGAGAEAGNAYWNTSSLSSGTITVTYPVSGNLWAAGSSLNSIVDTVNQMRVG